MFGRGCRGLVEACTIEHTAEPGLLLEEGASPEVRQGATDGHGAPNVGTAAIEGVSQQDAEKVDKLLGELDTMIGLAGVKGEVRALIDEIQVNEWRRNAGLPWGRSATTWSSPGAPGTGKTTVARIYGQLLKALGVLPSGHFGEVSRRTWSASTSATPPRRPPRSFDEALGGVLFIDEAYTLSRAGECRRDFGQEAIDTLVKLMEDHRDEVAVIVAGYTTEMAAVPGRQPRPGLPVRQDARVRELRPGRAGRHRRGGSPAADDYLLDAGPGRRPATSGSRQIERDPELRQRPGGPQAAGGHAQGAVRPAACDGLACRPDDLRTLVLDDLLVATR